MSQPPQISPDGRHYWDGQHWVPMPSTQPPARTLRQRLGMQGAVNSCVGYGCLAIALLFVALALSAMCSGHTT